MQRLVRWLRFLVMYLRRPPWDTGVSPPELLEFIRQNPAGRAIDLGCGTGTNLLTLANAGWQVTGVDFVPRAVSAARRKLKVARVPGEVRAGEVTRLADVRSADGNGYNLALDIGCYHGLPAGLRAAYRQNLFEILAPGGCFLIYAHWQTGLNTGSTSYTSADFDTFRSTFDLVSRQDSLDRWGRSAAWMLFRKA